MLCMYDSCGVDRGHGDQFVTYRACFLAVEWAEDMEISWTEVFSRDDLLHVRDFFKMGMDVAVMEEKVFTVLL